MKIIFKTNNSKYLMKRKITLNPQYYKVNKYKENHKVFKLMNIQKLIKKNEIMLNKLCEIVLIKNNKQINFQM